MRRLPDSHNALILRDGKQLGSRHVEDRMPKFGGKLNQGDQHEAAFGKARVRNLHSLFANHSGSVEENIEINDPRTARDKLPAAELSFNRLQTFQQLTRFER